MTSIYDEALKEIGNEGKFQKSFDVIYNVFMVGFFAMACMNILLILVVVPHECELPPKPHNYSEYEWKYKHLPLTNNAKGELTFSDCYMYTNEGSNETIQCQSFIYDKRWYENTAVTENNWVCDRELYVANVFAYTRIGEIVGSIALGWFGDAFGRRLTYIISILLTIIGRVISLLSGSSYMLFVAGCVITAVPSWMAMQSATVISMEISAPERRNTINTLRSIGWTAGMCVMPFAYWLLRDWRLFLIVTTSGLVPYLLLCWRVIESPRWLWLEGRQKECVRILKKIAKENGTRLGTNTERQLMSSVPSEEAKGLGPLALFSSWSLALNTTLQLTLWISMQVSYTYLVMATGESTSGNPFLEFAWQAAAEMPGNFLGAWLADTMGRRYSGGLSFVFSAVVWALISLRTIPSNHWLQPWWIGPFLSSLLRLSITVSYYVISLLNMELYPTCLRQSGMSLGNVVSSAASALGPYILFIGRNIDARMPGVILTGVSVFGTVATLLLPETLNRKLPETLEDARVFGRSDRNYTSLRFRKPKRRASVGKDSVVIYTSDVKRTD